VKADLALRCFGDEVGRGLIKAKGHDAISLLVDVPFYGGRP
jgi:hypothetical protein